MSHSTIAYETLRARHSFMDNSFYTWGNWDPERLSVLLNIIDNKGQSWDSNSCSLVSEPWSFWPVSHSVFNSDVFTVFPGWFLLAFLCRIYSWCLPFFIFVIDFLPVVRIKRADSRARVYGFKIFFFPWVNRELRSTTYLECCDH